MGIEQNRVNIAVEIIKDDFVVVDAKDTMSGEKDTMSIGIIERRGLSRPNRTSVIITQELFGDVKRGVLVGDEKSSEILLDMNIPKGKFRRECQIT